MAIYTAVLTAQSTSVYLCDIVKNRAFPEWFANGTVTGNFGTTGAVAFQISYDGGTTKSTLQQDGTATAASLTAVGTINLRCAGMSNNNQPVELYATIGTATTPSVAITLQDNR